VTQAGLLVRALERMPSAPAVIHGGEWSRPVRSRVASNAAVLVRPDGYIGLTDSGVNWANLQDYLTVVCWSNVRPDGLHLSSKIIW